MGGGDALEFALLRGVMAAARATGWRGSLALGARLGDTAHAIGIRRRVAEDNLRARRPDGPRASSAASCATTTRELGRVAAEYARLADLARAPMGEVVAPWRRGARRGRASRRPRRRARHRTLSATSSWPARHWRRPTASTSSPVRRATRRSMNGSTGSAAPRGGRDLGGRRHPRRVREPQAESLGGDGGGSGRALARRVRTVPRPAGEARPSARRESRSRRARRS